MKRSIKQMQSSLLRLLCVRFLSNQKILILLAALSAAVSAYAYDFKVEDIYYNVITSADNTKQVCVTCKDINSHTYSGCVNIPEKVEYYGVLYDVTSIGENAFYYCSGLTTVSIPNSVTSIGSDAFYFCSSLTSVTIPNSVTSIADSAFNGCSSLTTVTIPDSVTSIGNITFANCSGLTSVTIPESVTSIGDLAFYNCSSLTSVTIPTSVTSIGRTPFDGTALFEDDSNWDNGILYIGKNLISAKKFLLLGDYSIKAGTLTVAGDAFKECSGLTSVSIPNSVKSIGAFAFEGCSGLTSVTIPNSVISIDHCVFYGCNSLTSVSIPNSVTSIDYSAFYGCSSLTSVSIPNSVKSIGSWAFARCIGLTSVVIPNSMTAIEDGAFRECSSLTDVTVNNNDPSNILLDGSIFYDSPVSSATLYVPAGSEGLYASSEEWSRFGYIEGFQQDSNLVECNLVDGQPYTGAYGQQDVDVTYTRNFTSAVWQPLYVPFNMSYDEWKDYGRVAELSCVHAYDDGRTTIEFVTVNSGELLPNVPYVFLPNTTGEVTFSGTSKTLRAAPAENTKYIMCSSPRYTFKIYGNYHEISGNTLATYGDSQFNGAYVMTSDNKFQHCLPSATLKPYRFYITRERSTNGYWGAPARHNAPAATEEDDDDVIYFMVDGKVCGIADIVTDIDANGEIYDLMGREVKNPSNGIFIQNGIKTRIY